MLFSKQKKKFNLFHTFSIISNTPAKGIGKIEVDTSWFSMGLPLFYQFNLTRGFTIQKETPPVTVAGGCLFVR